MAHRWLRFQSIRPFSSRVGSGLAPILEWRQQILKQLQPLPNSASYRRWRHQMMLDRLHIGLWIALVCYAAIALVWVYTTLINPSHLLELRRELAKAMGDPDLVDRLIQIKLVAFPAIFSLLMVAGVLLQLRWWRLHPNLLFVGASLSLNLVAELMIPTVYHVPDLPDISIFMAQAILIPVHWRLHLLTQTLPLAYSLVVYPLLGMTMWGQFPIYTPSRLLQLILICLICDLGVYLYERLKRSEFEAQRRLDVFYRTIAHDLRTPIAGSAMLLHSLLPSTTEPQPEKLWVATDVIEQLAAGSDRVFDLLTTLLDSQTQDITPESLNQQPHSMLDVLESVVVDLQPLLSKHSTHLLNHLSAQLPPVEMDSHQVWRVWCNLLTNAVKHNPPGTWVILSADVIVSAEAPQRYLRCTVQDNGSGIPCEDRDRLFDAYTRGNDSQYTSGLGLGLHVCRQIVVAHGGKIGLLGRAGQGTTVWFTLPLGLDSAKSAGHTRVRNWKPNTQGGGA
jgi:signal transduction histidine kinase